MRDILSNKIIIYNEIREKMNTRNKIKGITLSRPISYNKTEKRVNPNNKVKNFILLKKQNSSDKASYKEIYLYIGNDSIVLI